jgi:hypothetical protein
MAKKQHQRTCKLAWQEPWKDERGRLVVGTTGDNDSERSMTVASAANLLRH